MDIQEQIFQAIDIITEQKLQSLTYDYTIEGIIDSETQNEDGSYNFLYQGMRLTAFPVGNVKYAMGDAVYILAISGDLSKKKIILTKKTPYGEPYVDIAKEVEKLNKAGRNYNFDLGSYTLLSGTEERVLNISNDIIIDSFAQTHLLVFAEVESNLQTVIGANYGVSITVQYKDGAVREYALTLNEVTGNPYRAKGNHYSIEELYLGSEMEKILGAKIFISGFPSGNESEYVKFSKISIQFIQEAIVEIANSITYKVEIHSTQGIVFKNGVVATTLIAKVYQGSDDITDSIDASRFKWTRSSANSIADDEWNATKGNGVKSIDITNSDVNERATFTCEVSD